MLNRQAQIAGRDFVLYGGMGFTQPEFRSKKLSFNLLLEFNAWAKRNNGIIGFMVSVSNAQGGDLGCLVCLLELPVSLAQTVIWERAVKVS